MLATTDDFDGWFAELAEDGQTELIAKVEPMPIRSTARNMPT
jgi:hypothetical protein